MVRFGREQGKTAVDFSKRGEHALARPSVIKFKGMYLMWFSKKGENYDYKKKLPIWFCVF